MVSKNETNKNKTEHLTVKKLYFLCVNEALYPIQEHFFNAMNSTITVFPEGKLCFFEKCIPIRRKETFKKNNKTGRHSFIGFENSKTQIFLLNTKSGLLDFSVKKINMLHSWILQKPEIARPETVLKSIFTTISRYFIRNNERNIHSYC